MSAITPTTPATFYGFKDQLVSIPLITLTVWVKGLQLAEKLGEDIHNIDPVVRKFLEAPDDYPTEYMLEHLEEVLRQTKEFYGIEEDTK